MGDFLNQIYCTEKTRYIEVGDKLYRVYLIYDIHSADVYTVYDLLLLVPNVNVTIKFLPRAVNWDKETKLRLARLKSKIEEESKSGFEDPRDVETVRAFSEMRESLAYSGESSVEVFIVVTVVADSEDELWEYDRRIKQALNTEELRMTHIDLPKEQLYGFKFSSMLASDDHITRFYQGHLIDTESGSVIVPFTDGSIGKGDIYIGHRLNGVPFFASFEGSGGQNMCVIGKTGSGKSFFIKSLVASLRMANYKVVILDLDGEYDLLAQALNGEFVDLSAGSGYYYDPFTPRAVTGNDEYDIQSIIESCNNAVSAMMCLAQNQSPEFQTLVDRAVSLAIKRPLEEYVQRKVYPDATIHDVYRELKQIDSQAANALYPYFEGIRKFAFSESRRIDFDNDLVVIHAAQFGGDQAVAVSKLQMVVGAVFDEVVRARKANRYIAVIMEEGQRALLNPIFQNLAYQLATTIRKYNGMFIMSTNSPQLMFESALGRAIWSSSEYKVLFYLDKDPAEQLKAQMHIDDDIIAELRETYGTHMFLFSQRKGGDDIYDKLRVDVPPSEAELYRTRKGGDEGE